MNNFFNKQSDTELSTCLSTSAISDILGGLGSFILNYFKMKFPKDFFKETYINESLNSNILARGIAHNQQLPFIGMEMEFVEEETLMGQLPRNHYPQQFIAKQYRDKYYNLIFEDVDKEVKIYSMPKRIRVNFNFLLKFQTHIAAIDYMHFINNHFEYGGINYVNGVRLPIEIPRYFINRIGMKYDLDPTNKEHNDELRHYMRDNSLGGMRYVINPTTGNKSYMYEYVTNILLQYPDLASSEANVNNMVIKDGTVSFSIVAELAAPSGFIMEIRDGEIIPFVPPMDDKDSYSLNFYIITDKIPRSLNDGKILIDTAKFVAEVNTGIDTIDVSEILSKDLRQTVEAIAKMDDFDIGKLFEYKLYANNKLLKEEEYDISFIDHKLHIIFPDTNVTYSLALYGDIRKLNDINELILTNNRHKIKPLLYSYM